MPANSVSASALIADMPSALRCLNCEMACALTPYFSASCDPFRSPSAISRINLCLTRPPNGIRSALLAPPLMISRKLSFEHVLELSQAGSPVHDLRGRPVPERRPRVVRTHGHGALLPAVHPQRPLGLHLVRRLARGRVRLVAFRVRPG